MEQDPLSTLTPDLSSLSDEELQEKLKIIRRSRRTSKKKDSNVKELKNKFSDMTKDQLEEIKALLEGS